MENHFLTNYTDQVFLDRIKENLRSRCKAFYFSVSFIKKAGLVLLFKDIESAIEPKFPEFITRVVPHPAHCKFLPAF